MANWLSNLLGGSETAETVMPVAEAATTSVATGTGTAQKAEEAPAGKKKIRLRFGKINGRQLKEMAQETLKSGGLDISAPQPEDKRDKDDQRDGQKGGGAGGGLSGIFNNAAQAGRASTAMKRRPKSPSP
jgi:hypothetical protein